MTVAEDAEVVSAEERAQAQDRAHQGGVWLVDQQPRQIVRRYEGLGFVQRKGDRFAGLRGDDLDLRHVQRLFVEERVVRLGDEAVLVEQRILREVVVQLDERLDDVQDGDQAGEDLLGETREQPDQHGPFHAGDCQSYDAHPRSHVDSHGEELQLVRQAKVVQTFVEKQQRAGRADDDQRLSGEQGHHHPRP